MHSSLTLWVAHQKMPQAFNNASSAVSKVFLRALGWLPAYQVNLEAWLQSLQCQNASSAA